MTKLKTSLAAIAVAAFGAGDAQSQDTYILDKTISGPFISSEDCAEMVVKGLLGSDPKMVISGKDNFEISGYSEDRSKQIFVTLNNGNVTELGVNLNGQSLLYRGWADISYGPKSSLIKVGGENLNEKTTGEIRDFITNVDDRLRYCGAVAQSGPVFNAG